MKPWNKPAAKKGYQSFIGPMNGFAGLTSVFTMPVFWAENWDAILSAGLLRTA